MKKKLEIYLKEMSKIDFNKLKKEINEVYLDRIDKCIRAGGHKPRKNSSYISSGIGGTRINEICRKCGMFYERNLTLEEMNKFEKDMRTPYTI